jgi:hypothetical protein
LKLLKTQGLLGTTGQRIENRPNARMSDKALAVDPASGAVLERLEMPQGTGVSGLESDRAELFYCGGGPSGKVRAVRRPAKRGDGAPEASSTR